MQFKLPFNKYQGASNDFVMINAHELALSKDLRNLLSSWQQSSPELARKLCDRHTGIGADGLILVLPNFPPKEMSDDTTYKECVQKLTQGYPGRDECDISWIYTNLDGSPAQMCGNGLRCLARFLHDKEITDKTEFKVATVCGPTTVWMKEEKSNDAFITTDIGKPILEGDKIPTTSKKQLVIKEKIQGIELTCLSVGNPHCVNFNSPIWDEADHKKKFLKIAHDLQADSFFPEGVNVEFVRKIDDRSMDFYVVERGCGPTLACSSGAAACVVAGVLEGRFEKDVPVDVIMPGGTVTVEWSSETDSVRITGDASFVFSGVIEFELACAKVEVSCP